MTFLFNILYRKKIIALNNNVLIVKKRVKSLGITLWLSLVTKSSRRLERLFTLQAESLVSNPSSFVRQNVLHWLPCAIYLTSSLTAQVSPSAYNLIPRFESSWTSMPIRSQPSPLGFIVANMIPDTWPRLGSIKIIPGQSTLMPRRASTAIAPSLAGSQERIQLPSTSSVNLCVRGL